jgi:hypothetical protein
MSNKAAIFLAFALVVSSVSNRLLEMYDQYDLLPTRLNGTTADSYGTVEYETNRFVGDSTRIIPRTVSGNVLHLNNNWIQVWSKSGTLTLLKLSDVTKIEVQVESYK